MPTQTTPNSYIDFCSSSTYYEIDKASFRGYVGQGKIMLPPDVVVRNSVPNYRALIQSKQNATGAYSRQIFEFDVATISGSTRKDPDEWPAVRGSGSLVTIPPQAIVSSVLHDDATRDIALKRLKSKLSAAESRFKALVPIGEVTQLRGMIRGMAEQTAIVIKAVRDIRNGRLPNSGKRPSAKAVAREASKAWLTWSFGIKPLISDAKALAETIADLIHNGEKNMVVRGSKSHTWFTYSKQTDLPYLTGASIVASTKFHHTITYTYTAGVRIKIAAGNTYEGLSDLGLTLNNLPSALWELTAFSWIADYFTTTGEFFEDVFESNDSNTMYCTLSTKYECVAESTLKAVADHGFAYTGSGTATAKTRFMSFDRTEIGQIPTRALRFKTLDEIGRNAVSRLLNLSSLLGSRK